MAHSLPIYDCQEQLIQKNHILSSEILLMLTSIVQGRSKILKVWLDMDLNLASDLFIQERSIFKAIKKIRFKEHLMESITFKHS